MTRRRGKKNNKKPPSIAGRRRTLDSMIAEIPDKIRASESKIAEHRRRKEQVEASWNAAHPTYRRPRTKEEAAKQRQDYLVHVKILRAIIAQIRAEELEIRGRKESLATLIKNRADLGH